MKITINGKEVKEIPSTPSRTDSIITLTGMASMGIILIGRLIEYMHIISPQTYAWIALASVAIGMVSIVGLSLKALTHIFKREK